MIATVEELGKVIQDGVDTYAAIEQTGIPDSVKQAVAENWELYVDKIQMEGLMHYAADSRRVDSQRIIPLEAVLRTIREMEEDVINKTVLDPLDIYFATVAGKYRFVKYLMGGLADWQLWWEAAKAIYQVISLGERGIIAIISNFFAIAAIPVMAAIANKVLRRRESWVQKMRNRALPIPKSGPRYRRKKPAR